MNKAITNQDLAAIAVELEKKSKNMAIAANNPEIGLTEANRLAAASVAVAAVCKVLADFLEGGV